MSKLNAKKTFFDILSGCKFVGFLGYGKCRHDIHKLNFNCNTKLSNFSKEEWNALISLKNRNDVVIRAADQGDGTAVWRTDLYQQEAIRNFRTRLFTLKSTKT